jgi:hypothetical protein
MNISRLCDGDEFVALLYQTQILSEIERPPLELFALPIYNLDKFEGPATVRSFVTICSFCQYVAWRVGSHENRREWITPEDYYMRGGTSDVSLSHGICPVCSEKFESESSELVLAR